MVVLPAVVAAVVLVVDGGEAGCYEGPYTRMYDFGVGEENRLLPLFPLSNEGEGRGYDCL